MKRKGSGWHNESQRHRMSAYGVKTSPIRIKASGYKEFEDELYEIDKAVLKAFELEEGEIISADYQGSGRYEIETDEGTFLVFKSNDEAYDFAVELVKEDLDDNPGIFNQEWLLWHIDGEEAEAFFRSVYDEWNSGYAYDIEDESSRGEFTNRLAEEMHERNIITEEQAKDEKFNLHEYIDDFIENMTQDQIDDGNGGYDYYKLNFGDEEANKLIIDNNLIDIDEASKDAVDTDGMGHFLSRYDGHDREISVKDKGNLTYFRTD